MGFMEAWQFSAISEAGGDQREHAQFFSRVWCAFQAMLFVAGAFITGFAQIAVKILAAPSYYEAWLYVPAGDVYFDPAEFGPYRLHVTQENVSEASADVTVKAAVHGKADVTLKVRNAAGKVVYKHTKNDVSGSYEHVFTLNNPHLWNGVEDPYLYTVELSAGDDDAMTEAGFRYYSIDREKGFFLNGKPYPLRGVSMHQDMDGKATALTYEDYDRDYETVRELGCNFLRLAHYPHNDYAFRLCDRMGIIVQTEIPWVNICGVRASEVYFENIHAQMAEMIRNLYNHPSIVFWGMWNELDSWGNKENFQGTLDARRVVDETARLYAYAKSLDPTRFVGLTDDSVFERDFYTQLRADYYSENRYFGWYYTPGDFSGLTESMHGPGEPVGIRRGHQPLLPHLGRGGHPPLLGGRQTHGGVRQPLPRVPRPADRPDALAELHLPVDPVRFPRGGPA